MDLSSTDSLHQAIEQVTDPTEAEENWFLIIRICDDVAAHRER